MNNTQIGTLLLCVSCLVPFILGFVVRGFLGRSTRRDWLPEWLRNILERIA